MFIPQDGASEIIAHFIGHFHLSLEDLRYRPDYQEFRAEKHLVPRESDVAARPFDFREILQLSVSEPSAVYIPPAFRLEAITLQHSVSFRQIDVPIPVGPVTQTGGIIDPLPSDSRGAYPGWVQEPGSTVLVVSQIKYLMDDDILVVGDHPFEAVFRTDGHTALQALSDTALSASSDLAELGQLRSISEMVGFVDGLALQAKSLDGQDFSAFDSAYVETADHIDGFYSNGATVEEQVTLKGAFPDDKPAQEIAPDTSASSLYIDASKTPTTMNVSSGGNVSWNEALIVNAGATAAVLAVVGDYHRIDAIYQTNVVQDIDTVDAGWPAQNLTIGGNVVQNSAGFSTIELTAPSSTSKAGTFPQNWTVSTVSGDLIFMDWVQQYNFTSDNDTQILTAMGTYTNISSGLNLGLNSLSFANLGKYYDLILVGGSVYDGNIISQTNVLLDDDKLELIGASSATKGNASTGENVVWNEALIENIGTSNWKSGLPSHYQEAADKLGAGDKQMPSGFSGDEALEGFANLKVLYVSGNIYDVHYVNQVNIVGDADNLAIYESNLLKAQDSVWQVTTGQNTLVNKATILDYDMVGNTAYVGGTLYSDAVLVQTDLLEGLAERVTVRGNDLANEVLAFLHDQTDLNTVLENHPAIAAMSDHGPSFDITQSVFA